MAKKSSSVFLIGLAAGIGIGLLLAPERGSKTRKKLKKKFREVSDNFQDEFSDEIEKMKTALHLDEEEVKPKRVVRKRGPKPKTV